MGRMMLHTFTHVVRHYVTRVRDRRDAVRYGRAALKGWAAIRTMARMEEQWTNYSAAVNLYDVGAVVLAYGREAIAELEA